MEGAGIKPFTRATLWIISLTTLRVERRGGGDKRSVLLYISKQSLNAIYNVPTTVPKRYSSDLLVISKKIIVVDISFKICDFLDTLSSARILNWNYIHFQTRFTL